MQIYLKAYFADAFSPIGVLSEALSVISLAFAYVPTEYPERIKFEFKWSKQSFHKFTFNQQAFPIEFRHYGIFFRKLCTVLE